MKEDKGYPVRTSSLMLHHFALISFQILKIPNDTPKVCGWLYEAITQVPASTVDKIKLIYCDFMYDDYTNSVEIDAN